MGGLVTWTGSTNTVWSTAGNWSAGAGGTAPPAADDDVIIPNVTNDPVLDAPDTINSLSITSGGNFDGNNHELTIGGEADGTGDTDDGFAINFFDGSIITGTDTDITLTTEAPTNVDVLAGTGSLRNLTINHASCAVTLYSTCTLTGGLTITAGSLDTRAANHPLTVAGDVSVTGTLTGNASAISMGSLTIASGGTYSATSGTTTLTSRTGGTGTYALENNGTFTHNNGTVAITDADDVVSMKLGASLYNLTLSGGTKKIRDNTTINNNLTLTSGDLYGHSGSLTLDVLGQTILNGGTTGQTIAYTGTMNWGNVTVNSGTLKLSSGTNNAESFRNVGGTIQ